MRNGAIVQNVVSFYRPTCVQSLATIGYENEKALADSKSDNDHTNTNRTRTTILPIDRHFVRVTIFVHVTLVALGDPSLAF